ncbi:MAG: tripartite tricarboxylate transporter substrate binding protein [Burkholderiales bacterium]|jgi:tripartite-type tricarboxylate transporter receptor subunit TctC|nr:tripartite tricarboxylate transporter substrate binding protein [Burkholderiales bacterium]
MNRTLRVLAVAIALATVAAPAVAQTACPDKPVRYYLPFPPGGESDIAARYQQDLLRKKCKQEMVIEYKTGAGGAIAWQQLNTLPGDGTNVMGINLPHVVLQPLEGQVQYKTDDLTPVYWFHYTPDAIVVPEASPIKTFKDLVAAAKAKPGEITLAGSGTNSANHAAHEKFNQLAGVKTTYVPFKGTGDLTTSVIGGHVSGAMSYSTFAIAQKGKVRMLAVATEKRLPQFPDVPTFKELGFDWIDGAYRGIAVPKSTPADARKRISDMMELLNKDPEMRQKMIDGGFEPVDITYELVPGFMADRTKAYMATAKQMGLAK